MRLKSSWVLFWLDQLFLFPGLVLYESGFRLWMESLGGSQQSKCFSLSKHSMVGTEPQFWPHILWTAPLRNLLWTITGDFVWIARVCVCVYFSSKLFGIQTALGGHVDRIGDNHKLNWAYIYVAVPRKQLKTPQKNHLVVFHQKYFFKSRLAFILYKKVFEYTAMHLATWKPDFPGGHWNAANRE